MWLFNSTVIGEQMFVGTNLSASFSICIRQADVRKLDLHRFREDRFFHKQIVVIRVLFLSFFKLKLLLRHRVGCLFCRPSSFLITFIIVSLVWMDFGINILGGNFRRVDQWIMFLYRCNEYVWVYNNFFTRTENKAHFYVTF